MGELESTSTREVAAVQGTVSIDPDQGDCEAPFRIHGKGFAANSQVQIRRFEDLTESVQVAGVTADATGDFDVELEPPDFGPDCAPGLSAVFVAGPAGQPVQEPGPWPRAVFEIAQLGEFTATPSQIPCGRDQGITINGSGFPPNTAVALTAGAPDPMAHNIISLGQFHTDAGGNLKADVSVSGTCNTQIAVYGRTDEVRALWRVVIAVAP